MTVTCTEQTILEVAMRWVLGFLLGQDGVEGLWPCSLTDAMSFSSQRLWRGVLGSGVGEALVGLPGPPLELQGLAVLLAQLSL